MKIVIDTNVLIAAFIARGFAREIFDHCLLRHEVVISEHILDELSSKLRAKFGLTSGHRHVSQAKRPHGAL